MIFRIENFLTSKVYMIKERVEQLEKGELQINLHATTLCLKFFNFILEDIIRCCDDLLLNSKRPKSKGSSKLYYAKSARLYWIDSFLLRSFFEDEDSLFYKPQSDPVWTALWESIDVMMNGEEKNVIGGTSSSRSNTETRVFRRSPCLRWRFTNAWWSQRCRSRLRCRISIS